MRGTRKGGGDVDGRSRFVALIFAVVVSDCIMTVYAKDFKLTILHTNDIHARIDEFDAKGSRCDDEASAKHKCYGGIARQKYMVDKIRSSIPDTIFLNAGDYYQGTMWFFMLKADIISDAITFLNHDAMTLGNHEFDDGSAGLLPLLVQAKKISTPVVTCNVDFSNDPILRKYQPLSSIVLERSGVKIGVIGFLTPDTDFLSNPDNGTIFTDEIECISREAEKLYKDGVRIIIATGHSGYIKDMEIAQKIPLVKMVVGGHSHSYLSSVDQNTKDPVKGPYPTVVTRKDGTKALVVQDFWLGKYLGYINVTFDKETGDVRSWEGDSPLLLDYSVPKDPEVEEFLKSKRSAIDAEANTLIGYNAVELSGDKEDCRFGECALGNMLADALTRYFVEQDMKDAKNRLPNRWKSIDIAVINGGGIRGSLSRGNVTYGDVVTIFPFANPIWVLTLTGAQIQKMYENSIHRFDVSRLVSSGGFLQSSGVRIVADITKPPFKRIRSIEVLCTECQQAEWEPLDPNREYRVAMTDYIAQGGDKHDFHDVPNSKIQKFVVRDTDIARDFIAHNSPVYAAKDRRFRLITTAEGGVCVTPSNFAAGLPTVQWPQQLLMLLTMLFVFSSFSPSLSWRSSI